mmetsp:Transcript_5595/g.10017  ORF Transcript_5595/g.10017 Transcript_5595/m.10017 type:complete len:208 (+) Transcript_5595:172-795(+)
MDSIVIQGSGRGATFATPIAQGRSGSKASSRRSGGRAASPGNCWSQIDTQIYVELIAGLVVFASLPHRSLSVGVCDQIPHMVVDEAMISFISSHDQNHVTERSIFWHVPVLNGNLWRRDVLDLTLINHVQHLGIGVHSFLLKVANKAMGYARRDNIEYRVGREEHTLASNDHQALVPSLLRQFHEGHQMHALVLRLIHGRLDPIAMH